MMRALLRLLPTGKTYEAEVRPRAFIAQVRIDLHRWDAQPSPHVVLSLEDARTLLRQLQGACDEAYRLAKVEAKRDRKDQDIDRAVDGVARAISRK